ncbi:hypothetical protein SAMN04487934_103184 [Eubacterium ruminantium]|nr:hypothetical protein SAMN04487934_103184 [Eubacterium ruminantium]
MSEKFDYKTLRILPYAVLGILVIIPVISIILAVFSIEIITSADNSRYDMVGVFVSKSVYMKYLAAVVAYVCFYRLSDVVRWFNAAWLGFIMSVATELFLQVVLWVGSFFNDNSALNLFTYIVSLLPDLCIMLGVFFAIRGFADIYKETAKEKKASYMDKLKFVWMALDMALLFFTNVQFTLCVFDRQLVHYDRSSTPSWLLILTYVFEGFLIAVILAYIVMSWKIYFKIKQASYDYYLYRYNTK